MGLAPTFSHLHDSSIIADPCPPTFPWTHNNNETITICDGICNMENFGIFYLVSWCARFLRLYTFSKGINIPSVHPLHGGTEMNCKRWLSKGLNIRQWQTILAIMQEEGPCCLHVGWGH